MSQEQQVWGVILASAISLLSFIAGKIYEQRQQSLTIKAKMLEPIEEWLAGAERIIQMVSDTLATVTLKSPLPRSYSFGERTAMAQFMGERDNQILGIVMSNALRTWRTRQLSNRLNQLILAINQQIKYILLPLDNEILSQAGKDELPRELVMKVLETKLSLDMEMQEAHSIIAQLKTSLV